MDIKTDYVQDVLFKAWCQRHRLQVGLKERETYCFQLMAGEDVSHHPRGRQMQEAASLLKDFLLDIAREFDNKNPQDKLSTLDALDILRLVARTFS